MSNNIVLIKAKKTAYERSMDIVENDIVLSINKGIKRLRETVSLKKLEQELEKGLVTYFDKIIDWNILIDIFEEEIKKAITDGVILGAKNELKKLKPIIKAVDTGLDKIIPEIPFTLENPRIKSYLAKRSQEMSYLMVNSNVEVIETVVRLNFNRGYTPRQIANVVRGSIGLNKRQAIAVDNLTNSLRERGLSESLINKQTKSYSERLINSRAKMIARTEVMTAVNTGQKEVWNEAFNGGYLKKGEYVKEWNTALDDMVCEYCEPLDGVTVGVDEPFPSPLGDVDTPPLHASCRCLSSLKRS